MKKAIGFVGIAILALAVLSGCQTLFGRGHGPVVSFAFLPEYNSGLSRPIQGQINEFANPKIILVVVPPGTDMSHLVATFAFSTEASISVVSSGQSVAQTNSKTANNFESPVLYSIKTPKDKQPWEYQVMVRQASQNALLSGIRVVSGTALEPAFQPNVTSYTSTVPYASTQVTIETTAQDPHLQKTSIEGHEVPGPHASIAVPFSGVNSLSVPITTTAEDQTTTAQYTLNIVRGRPDTNSALSSLSLLNYALDPVFSPAQLSYSVLVPFPTSALTLKAVPQSQVAAVSLSAASPQGGLAPLQVVGNPTTGSGAQVAFAVPQQENILIVVTAQDGSKTSYTLTVTRAAPDHNNFLADLQIPEASISPQFDPNITQYNVVVPYNASQFRIVAPPESSVAGIALAGGQISGDATSANGATVQFANTSNLQLAIRITAQDGGIRTYTLYVQRGQPDTNSRLATLLVTPGTMSPSFSSQIVTYNAVIPGNVSAANVTVQTESPYATVATTNSGISQSGSAANGQVFTIPIPPAQTRALDLTVTAQDGSQRLYRVNITREAPPVQPQPKEHNSRLSGIVVAGGNLSPQFTPENLAYAVNLPTARNRVSILPIAESPRATVLIDGRATGNAAQTIQLEPGKPRVVVVQVVAEDGSSTQYTVTLTRELPRREPPRPVPPAGPGGPAVPAPAPGLQPQPAPPPLSSQQPAAAPPQAQAILASMSVRADGVRVDPREWKRVRDSKDVLGSEAVITVKPEGSEVVLLQSVAPVQIRQPGNSPAEITLNWQSQQFSVTGNQRLSVDVAIPTQRGSYLRYTTVVPAQAQMAVTVPAWSYGESGN